MFGTRSLAWALIGALALLACKSDDGNPGGSGGGVGAAATGGATGATGGTGSPMGGGATAGTVVTGAVGGTDIPPTGGTGGVGATGGAGGTVGGTGGTGGTTVAADTWPMMGYDSRNWYFNPTETTISVANAATLVEKWRFTVGGMPPGTPAIAEGKVFVNSTPGGTYAIDLESGAMAWHRPTLAGANSIAYEGGFVYVHDETVSLSKLNAADGTTVWGPIKTNALAGCSAYSSPIVGGGLVIVGRECGPLEVGIGGGGGQAKGGIEAFNTADGAKAWSYQTVEGSEDGAMAWSSVGIDVAGGVVYVATGNNYTVQGANSDSIHAVSITNGTRMWKTQVRNNDTWSLFVAGAGPDTDFGANPIITDTLVAAGDKGSAFWALNKAGGAIAWKREGLTPSRNMANGGILMNGAFDGTNFYAISNDPTATSCKIVAMNGTTGADVWAPKTYPKITWGAPSVANGVLYAAVDDDLVILDAATGAELKKFTTGGSIAAGAPAVAGGKVVVGSGLTYPFGPTAKPGTTIIAYGLP